MIISEQIKLLCVYPDISVVEFVRRLGITSQNFDSEIKQERFMLSDLKCLAEMVRGFFECHFVRPDGKKV